MKRILSFHTVHVHIHTPCGYQELPLTGLCFISSYRASGKDTLPLSSHPSSFAAAPHLLSIPLFSSHRKFSPQKYLFLLHFIYLLFNINKKEKSLNSLLRSKHLATLPHLDINQYFQRKEKGRFLISAFTYEYFLTNVVRHFDLGSCAEE